MLTETNVLGAVAVLSIATVKQNDAGPEDNPSARVTEAGVTVPTGEAVALITVPPGGLFKFASATFTQK